MKPLPRRKSRLRPDVGIAIVNIVLLLILFFLVTGQNAAPDALLLPETSQVDLDQLPRPTLLVREDAWLLDGSPVAPEYIAIAMQRHPHGTPLNLLIDRDAPATLLGNVIGRPELRDIPLRLVTLRAG